VLEPGPSRLRDDPDAFDALRDATSASLGLIPGIVEKDYWATEVLRTSIGEIDGAQAFVFKGGTSLSKAFSIIERFSEDIDLIVVTNLEGNPRKRLLRAIADQSSALLATDHEREHEGKGFLNVRYSCETRTNVDFLSNGVKLEMGCRGGPAPNEQRRVESLMAATAEGVSAGSRADYVDLEGFKVTVLAPQRTLAEKLAFLHHRASVMDLNALRQGARHLYDVYRLLNHESTRAALVGGVIANLMDDVDERSRLANWGYTTRPAQGFSVSAAFRVNSDATEALKIGYEEIAYLIWGQRPEFHELIACIHDNADLL
jgi:predicted nucleotidyltransferase component of viral defense system